MIFKKKYRYALPARFLSWRNPSLPSDRVWFHSCSFGETRAIEPLVRAIGPERSVLSIITQTGFEEGERFVKEVRYLPFEPLLWWWVRPQKALVVMEAELWYLLFYLAKRKGARTMLINARISDRSWPRYRRFAWFYRYVFSWIDEVYAQSNLDADRLKSLGARQVAVTGNIKLANLPKATEEIEKPEGIVVTAASTHEGEEEGIVEAFFAFQQRHREAKLLVVPRHPERFDKVYTMLELMAKREGVSLSRWSKTRSVATDIVLVDRMGVLVNFYAISDIVVLGGAFVPVGGHNPAEVLPFGCRLISGRHIFNQKAMFDSVVGTHFCDLNKLDRALESALKGEPLHLKVKVSLEPVLKGLQNVV